MFVAVIGSAHDVCHVSWETERMTATTFWGEASHELPSKRSSNSRHPSMPCRPGRRCHDHVHRDRRISLLEFRDTDARCVCPLVVVEMGMRWAELWEQLWLACGAEYTQAAEAAANADEYCKVHIDGYSNFACVYIDADDDWTDADKSQESPLTSDATRPFYDSFQRRL